MKKVLLLFILCAVVLISGAADDKPIITVLDFTADGVSELEMKSIINYLSSSLFKTGQFTVIDISQRENILNELEFSMSGCSDDSCYLEIGKMLSAEGIVTGSIGRVGSRFILTAKLLKTETGATISSSDGMYADLDELLDDIQSAAEILASPYSGGAQSVIVASEESDELISVAEPERAEIKSAPESEEEPAEKSSADFKPESGSSKINWPAWGTLGSGAVFLGAGSVLLAITLPAYIDYKNAVQAYTSAVDSSSAEQLYADAEAARVTAIEANVNFMTPLGIGFSAAGIGLGIISIFLFNADDNEDIPEISFLPSTEGVSLSFRISR